MKITNEIIKSSYFCLYKTYLKINGECGRQTEYEEMEAEIKHELISKYILNNRNPNSIIVSDKKINNKKHLNFKTISNVSYSNGTYYKESRIYRRLW